LRAEKQTAGRGRLGRSWQCAAGNLFASTLIRLRPSDPVINGLSLMTGVAVHDALGVALPEEGVTLKWPNDVMVNGAKLAGILLEREGDAIIVGVGVNVASAPEVSDRATAALAHLAAGHHTDAARVQDQLVQTFDHWVEVWRAGGTAAILPEWLKRAHPLGTALVANVAGGSERGRFAGLDPSGALKLERDDGTTLLVHSGDVGILP
jgi:BirA family biotin operon repressor/biotin-[acetyl-CoA-carboxylase] ligase